MELRFAHLADYAAADSSGKLTVVGIFDLVWDRLKLKPIPFPSCYLVASFAASFGEGSAHQLTILMVDSDEQILIEPIELELQLHPSGPGNPLRAQVVLALPAGALRVPQTGDCLLRFVVDGVPLGELPVSVREPPPAS